jgi:putative transposase
MDGVLMQAPVRGQPVGLEEEALGRNPTDRGRSGRKTHLHVDQPGIPLGVTLTGANVHDSRLISPTLEADVLPRPDPTPEQPQHLCLDKGYDYPRVEEELKAHTLYQVAFIDIHDKLPVVMFCARRPRCLHAPSFPKAPMRC